jgi:hypothetical protein
MEISPLQLSILRALHTYKKNNGNLPSLKNLVEEAGLPSNNVTTVVRQLAILERAGLIERSHDKERRPSITSRGLSVRGVTDSISLGPKPSLMEQLHDIDEELPEIYEAAWDALTGSTKRKVATAAHHMRDVGYRLADYENGEDRLEKYRLLTDPDARKTVDFSSSVHAQLVGITHQLGEIAHGKRKVEEEELVKLMKRYEDLLSMLLSQYAFALNILDDILEEKPSDEALKRLADHISLNLSARIYFFNHVPITWVKFLVQQDKLPFDFFRATGEFGDLVVRVAKEDGDLASDLILRVKPSEYSQINAFVAGDVFKVLDLIHPHKIDAVVSTVLPLLEQDKGDYRYYPLVEALKKEQVLNKPELRNRLFKAIVANHLVHLEEKQGYQRDGTSLLEAALVLRRATDKEAVAEIFLEAEDALAKVRPSGYTRLRIFSLDHPGVDRYSREPIEQLTPPVMEQLNEVFSDDLSDAAFVELFARLFPKKDVSSLLTRMKLHFLRKRPQVFIEVICDALASECWKNDVRKEWGELLQASFPLLSSEQKASILEVMSNPPSDTKEERRALRIAERFIWIKDALEPSELPESIKELVQSEHLLPEPTVITSWVGPESPKTTTDLKIMASDELVAFLSQWKPAEREDSFFGPSFEGLGRVLQQAIQEEPQRFVSLLEPANLRQLEPTYVAHIFNGYDTLLKNKKEAPIPELIVAINWLAEETNGNSLREASRVRDGRFESNVWREAHRAVGYIIETILQDDTELTGEQVESIRRMCNYLITDADPTEERENDFVKDHDELSLPLNAVRGIGLTAYIYLFLYEKRNHGLKQPTAEFKERLMNAARGGSVCDATVIGQHLPWLYYSDIKWFTEVWSTIGSAPEPVKHAAWIGFMVSRLDPQVFGFLHEWYRSFVEKILRPTSSDPGKKRRVDLAKMLPEHMVYAVAYDYPHAREIMEFVLGAQKKDGFSPKARNQFLAEFVSFFGRAFVHGSNRKDGVSDLQYVQNLIEVIVTKEKSTAAREAFGWCVTGSVFAPDWLLKTLEIVLKDTEGAIDGSYLVIEFLKEQAAAYTSEVLRCLALLVSGVNRDRWLVSGHKHEIQTILDQARRFGEKDPEIAALEEKTRDLLLKQGFMEFREKGPKRLDSDNAS